MSKIRAYTKNLVERVPAPLGKWLVAVPFRYRLGGGYATAAKDIGWFEAASAEARRGEIFRRVRSIVFSSYKENEFYREFYDQRGFHPEELSCYDDLSRVPIVTKGDLRGCEVGRRSTPRPGRLKVNTGGTSGQPLEFYLDRGAFAREWAHMHRIWKRIGYRHTDLKLTFRGRNLGGRVVQYNPVHNEYIVSAYHSQKEVRAAIAGILKRGPIRFLHGYPSAIYEFARGCEESGSPLTTQLRSSLRGVLYGSEFPAAVYRETVDRVFDVPSISWYGHSEMAILAYEEQRYRYAPMHSYGYVEAVPSEGRGYRLVGTSYGNDASPFIRYDTGDLVEPEFEGGLLTAFRVAEGRSGDFVLDRDGNRISLTALIFGRHHELFRMVDHLQVRQDLPGRATILVSRTGGGEEVEDLSAYFDASNVKIDFQFQYIDSPIRTVAGKLPLLVTTT